MKTGFYLGVKVEILEDLGNGWVLTQWPKNKTWRQWREQIKTESWGNDSV